MNAVTSTTRLSRRTLALVASAALGFTVLSPVSPVWAQDTATTADNHDHDHSGHDHSAEDHDHDHDHDHSTDGDAAGQTPGHKPGESASPMSLPADTKIAGTDTVHPCAGRDLLYHAHIDAPYITRDEDGNLSIMAVDNSAVTPSDAVCLRLAPDGADGQEVSRMVVPDDPKLSFLGAPGTILWHSPLHNYTGWRPLWAGYGAFDPHHENVVPNDLVGNTVQLNIADFDGPGDMEVFNYFPGWKRPNRLLSSKDVRSNTVRVGGHGHMNWTFSKPGIYTITFEATGRLFDGTTVTSGPVKQIWLVGDDADVGLAPGTTVGLDSYSVSAEDVRADMGLSEPTQEQQDAAAAPPAAPTSDQPLLDSEELTAKILDDWPPRNLNGTISSGSLVSTVEADEDGYLGQRWDLNGERQPGSVWIEVPDNRLNCVDKDDKFLKEWISKAGKTTVWATPSAGDDTPNSGPSVSYSTAWADFDTLDDQKLTYDIGFDSDNPGMAMVGVDGADGSFVPVTVEGQVVSKPVQFLTPGTNTPRFVFSEPGIYKTDITAKGRKTDGTFTSALMNATFIVGNDAINTWRSANDPDAELLSVDADRSCGDHTLVASDPTNYPVAANGVISGPDSHDDHDHNDHSTEPSTTEESTPAPTTTSPDSEPTTALPTAEDLTTLWGDTVPSHVVTQGHMDLALDNEGPGGAVAAHLHDEADPSHEVARSSGSFVFVVPSNTKTTAPEKFSTQTGFTGSVYVLPQVQQAGVPWVGFSTLEATSGVKHPVTITLAEVQGPGRLATGHIDPQGDVDLKLDSANSNSTIVYTDPAHDHQYWWFSAPGAYKATLRYSWTDADGTEQHKDLVSSFLVGDETIATGHKVIAAAKTSTTPSTTSTPSSSKSPVPSSKNPPVKEPKSTPTKAPGSGEPTGGSSDTGSMAMGIVGLLALLSIPAVLLSNPAFQGMLAQLAPGIEIPGLPTLGAQD